MPKRDDIHHVLVLGSGPIVIGQACEFDYSGVQACQTLREEGIRVILVNTNPASIMTDIGVADRTYLEPMTKDVIQQIMKKEQIDAILPTLGGQTAINLAMELHRSKVLDDMNIEIIGAHPRSIALAEDRIQFSELMNAMDLPTPKSRYVTSLDEAMMHQQALSYPINIRSSYTLGGKGGGLVHNQKQFVTQIQHALTSSPVDAALIEESIFGWKEFELEVVRDKKDNCMTICSIENIDPVGIHTGDSITVAPALTLTDREYQTMRARAFDIIRAVGVNTGGANVQFAVNPVTRVQWVIEMNPRVSRSSALASKATGYPIARVATKLAIGYTLDEIRFGDSERLSAAFEPVLDYVVVKIPKFNTDKLDGVTPMLGTSMRSVGEAMAIGGCFTEALQKAILSLDGGYTGLNEIDSIDLEQDLASGTEDQLLYIAEAFRQGMSWSNIHAIVQWDPWFLNQIEQLIAMEQIIITQKTTVCHQTLRQAKHLGFSNKRLAQLMHCCVDTVEGLLVQYDIYPVYKRIDSTAAEIDHSSNYLYSTHTAHQQPKSMSCEAAPTCNRKVILIGSGPNRIGQGIEFDYSCVRAALTLKTLGYECIMINCNPETVSTDHTTSSKLYFSPLTAEELVSILNIESTGGTIEGVILQFGGQTAINLARDIEQAGYHVLGAGADLIDTLEDRAQFQAFVGDCCKQTKGQICRTLETVLSFADVIGYPIIIRPSFVIGGHHIHIGYHEQEIRDLLTGKEAAIASGILVESFLENACELEVDAISDGTDVWVPAVLEHIEKAGIHSGDSKCVTPCISISSAWQEKITALSQHLVAQLSVRGMINIQYAIHEDELYVLEMNPRASRTIPFISKALGIDMAGMATQIIMGHTLNDVVHAQPMQSRCAIKVPVFSQQRFQGGYVKTGPQMKSTGESMFFGSTWAEAFIKSLVDQQADGLSESPRVLVLSNHSTTHDMDSFVTRLTRHSWTFFQCHITTFSELSHQLSDIEQMIIDKGIQIVFNQLPFYVSQDKFYQLIATYDLLYLNSVLEMKALIEFLENPKTFDVYCLQDMSIKS